MTIFFLFGKQILHFQLVHCFLIEFCSMKLFSLEKKCIQISVQLCICFYWAYCMYLDLQAFLQMCNLPIKVVCRANAEYMSPSGKCVFFFFSVNIME